MSAQVRMEAVRRAVAAAADELQRRRSPKPLDESKGARDWKRLRAEWHAEADAAGRDWIAALIFPHNIPAGADYAEASVIDTTESIDTFIDFQYCGVIFSPGLKSFTRLAST